MQALATQRFASFTLQAAIAAVHAEAPSTEQTDWRQIVGLYDALLRHAPLTHHLLKSGSSNCHGLGAGSGINEG